MERRALGRTGLEVTVLGYGAMELRRVSPGEADHLLNAVLDGGVNFIDTAPDYGPSEECLGRAVAHRRDEFVLATKCGCNIPRPGDGAPAHIWTGAQVRHNLETSLQRLRTDRIDVWQIHSAEPADLEQSDVIETMLALRDQGKVRHIAVSARNGDAPRYGHDQLRGYLRRAELEVVQCWYSALARINEALIDRADGEGRGLILRGAVRAIMGSRDEAWAMAGLQDLLPPGTSREAFLLRFVLARPAADTVIVGTSSAAHLQANLAAAEAGPLSADLVAEAQRRLDDAGFVAGQQGPW